jgi:hypothetical protein
LLLVMEAMPEMVVPVLLVEQDKLEVLAVLEA